MAFVFGSQATGRAHTESDWDIAVYFTPGEHMELETNRNYAGESAIRGDIGTILGIEFDLLVLNRARPALVFTVLNTGVTLTNKNRKLYLGLLLKTHYEAVDYWQFVQDFWKIRERSHSLTPEDKSMLIEHLVFLENELKDLEQFKSVSWEQFANDRHLRRNLERWVENLAMALLDIAKIILASEKRDVPQTYRETLRTFALLYMPGGEGAAETFAGFTDLRNLIAHEYLDYRFEHIRSFISTASDLLPAFLARVKELIEKE